MCGLSRRCLRAAVGVAADSLQICTSFVSRPNVTSNVTMPISVGSGVTKDQSYRGEIVK